MTKPTVVMERYPYRYVTCGNLEINGKPDCRIQKWHDWTKRYRDMYFCDNETQMLIAIEDKEYTKWLDPDPEVGAYRKFD
jgi:hypothetical protein